MTEAEFNTIMAGHQPSWTDVATAFAYILDQQPLAQAALSEARQARLDALICGAASLVLDRLDGVVKAAERREERMFLCRKLLSRIMAKRPSGPTVLVDQPVLN